MPSRILEPLISQCEDSQYLRSLISENGFLPSTQPLRRLPDPYYEEWEEILDDLPTLLRHKTLRNKVDGLRPLTTDHLTTEREWQRAYVILCFLAHGYIWGGDVPSEILPPSITVPFLQVSGHLDLPPVATYAALNLWNFRSAGEDFTDLNNLRALHTFTGTEDECWFYVLSVAVEARGARIVPPMLEAADAIQHNDYETVSRALSQMASCIRGLTRLLDRMSEKCDPMVFYHKLRPFLAGTKNMAAAGLPNGVFYDEGDGMGQWRQLRGGSNGQSSLIQFFDHILGIEHVSTGNRAMQKGNNGPAKAAPGELSFHEEVRLYMPNPHRRFLAGVSRMDKIREFVQSAQQSPAQRELQQSYQNATEAFGDFRQAHMQMVTRYIVVPSRKPSPFTSISSSASSASSPSSSSSAPINLATTTTNSVRLNHGATQELTGTGGTDLIPFLRTARDETYGAGRSAVVATPRDISVSRTRKHTAMDRAQKGLMSSTR